MEDTNIIEDYNVVTDEDGDTIFEQTQSEQNESVVVPDESPDPQQNQEQKESESNTIPEETEIIDDAAKEGVNDNFLEDVFKILLKDKLGDDSEEKEESTETAEDDNLNKGDNANEDEMEVSSGNSGGSDIDYTGILGDISGKLDNNNENIEYLISQTENNNMNSTLNTQSCTNVLLIMIIIILLVDIIVHFIRGIF